MQTVNGSLLTSPKPRSAKSEISQVSFCIKYVKTWLICPPWNNRSFAHLLGHMQMIRGTATGFDCLFQNLVEIIELTCQVPSEVEPSVILHVI